MCKKLYRCRFGNSGITGMALWAARSKIKIKDNTTPTHQYCHDRCGDNDFQGVAGRYYQLQSGHAAIGPYLRAEIQKILTGEC